MRLRQRGKLRVLLAISQPGSSRSGILIPSVSSETRALSLEFGLPARSQGSESRSAPFVSRGRGLSEPGKGWRDQAVGRVPLSPTIDHVVMRKVGSACSVESRELAGIPGDLKHPPFWRGICRKKKESHLRQEREEKHHSLSCFIVQVTLLDLLRAGFASGGSEQRGPEGVRVRGILGRGRGVRPGRPARCTPPLRT